MASCVTHYFVTFLVTSTNIVVIPVDGQSTVQGCEVGDESMGIFAEIHDIKSQQDIIIKSLHAVDRRSQEQDVCMKQVQGIYNLLNASFLQHRLEQDTLQQMESQQNTATSNLQADNQRLQDQVQSMFKFLNSSLQQMKTQLDTLTTNLQAVDRRPSSCDTSISNQTQILWKLAKVFGIDDWIVIMNRFNGSVGFNRNWSEYRNGFGDKEGGEFWLGNEEVHRLTNRFNCTLRIEVQPNATGEWYYAEYSTFSLESEDNKYTLRLSGYSGNAGNSLTNTSLVTNWYHGGMKFSTTDNDNDRLPDYDCAQTHRGGWWFNKCYISCLTCNYLGKFQWYHPAGWPTSGHLRAARMMIKGK